jgi:thiamine biosynthesis lipoprotein
MILASSAATSSTTISGAEDVSWTRRELLIGAGGVLVASNFPASAAVPLTIAGPAFGSSWRALLPQKADSEAIKVALANIVQSIDAALSPFRATSEISRFNVAATTDWWPLSTPVATVVGEGLRIAAMTDGAFDPSVGGIVGRYGFGPIRQSAPSTYRDLESRISAVRKSGPGLTFDPCGIAKGYALDLMANHVDSQASDFLIEIGGEVFARGSHPDGRPWSVGLERPLPGPITFQRLVRLDGEAVATSGDTVNGYELGGRRYSHIIDPRTREPVTHDLASVSVISASAMTADALATALMAMGPEAGVDFAERSAVAALFVVRDGKQLRQIQTTRFVPYVVA